MVFTVTIKKNDEFVRIYKNGRHYAGKYMILYVSDGNPGINAIGVTASRKVGKSVRRNRIKRLIKENYRLYEPYVHAGFNFVFIVRARQDRYIPDYHEIHREMKSLFLRAGAFDLQRWENSRNGA